MLSSQVVCLAIGRIMTIRDVISQYTTIQGNKCCCPIHGEKTPSLQIYDDTDSWYCWGCARGGDAINFIKELEDVEFNSALEIVSEILGVTKEEYMEEKKESTVSALPSLTDYPEMDMDVVKAFISEVGYKSNNYRGIREESNRFFGHLTKMDSEGNVLARYYPETNSKGKVVGYKCRNHPKDFTHGKIGNTGSKSQLSGQVKYKTGGKYVLIVGGEEDKVAAYQMLRDNDIKRGNDAFTGVAVVSPTIGESGAAKQIAAQYNFLDSFEIIVVGMDNDAAGKEAAIAVANVLPKEKVRIATWSSKDPNQMLLEGKEAQFVRDFYNAKPLISTGVKDSTTMLEAMKDELLAEKISLPPHMHRLQEAMGGGIRQQRIVNIIGDTSAGKSTHVNSMVYHWIFNAPAPVCVVSLEATEGQYALDIASLHLEKNLHWYNDGKEIVDYLDRNDVKALLDNLMYKEDGTPRYYIIDERDGSIELLEKQMERMFRQYGCRIFVIDVLTDILRGSAETKQEDHMKWQKQFVKNGATLVNVLHTRKPPINAEGKARKVTEYDALGSGTFVQSAAINIVINRDKMADGVEKNTTYVDMPKCRGGKTGEICKLYYDFESRKVYDYDDWVASRSITNIHVDTDGVIFDPNEPDF